MRYRPRQRHQWPIETFERAAELWQNGFSASIIGAAVGRTRSAVLGLAHRNRDRFPQRVTA